MAHAKCPYSCGNMLTHCHMGGQHHRNRCGNVHQEYIFSKLTSLYQIITWPLSEIKTVHFKALHPQICSLEIFNLVEQSYLHFPLCIIYTEFIWSVLYTKVNPLHFWLAYISNVYRFPTSQMLNNPYLLHILE